MEATKALELFEKCELRAEPDVVSEADIKELYYRISDALKDQCRGTVKNVTWTRIGKCPVCNTDLVIDFSLSRCPRCGKKLYWEESKGPHVTLFSLTPEDEIPVKCGECQCFVTDKDMQYGYCAFHERKTDNESFCPSGEYGLPYILEEGETYYETNL